MKFSLYIAKRYAFSKSKSKAINVITTISSVGIVVSAMAMFIVLSVFSGLKAYSLSFVDDLDPDLKVFTPKGKSFVVEDRQILDLEESGYFKGVAKVVEDRLLFSFKDKQAVSMIKGIDSDFVNVTDFDEKVEYGSWLEPDTDDAVVGVGMSHLLSMGLFDTENAFEALALKPGKGTIENPEDAFIKRHLNPTGVYVLGNDDLDNKYVFVDIDNARALLNIPTTEVTNLELAIAEGVSEGKAIQKIKEVLGEEYIVKNKTQLNDGLYRMLNMENLVVYLIFVLVVIMALFTLVGSMIMIILEKQPNIKTLNQIGVPVSDLRKIFLFQGLIICVLGSVIGLVLGGIVVSLQVAFGFISIREGLAYPVAFNWVNIFVVLVSIIALGLLASLVSSSRVNNSYLKL
ncbi:FtsX-like permease family protein [Myroides odoratimimus]|uniref:ABC transporter permease n=1 Tax=Myroides odoratimimus TaxID=76832 RepID=UPI002DBF18F8|nr:FtsX-like permease family protein [Myroides odoratimimus]MEC4052622.1 FtsX-like permease family protein [Myroides odoratimimus]